MEKIKDLIEAEDKPCKLSKREWVPVIEKCLRQEGYGSENTCSLCLACNRSDDGCMNCIVIEHNRSLGIDKYYRCGEGVRAVNKKSCDWSDIPAVHCWLNALLAWTKEQAAKEAENTPCENDGKCKWLADGAQSKAHDETGILNWYCIHPKADRLSNGSGVTGRHCDDCQPFIFKSCPGKETGELWGAKCTSGAFTGIIYVDNLHYDKGKYVAASCIPPLNLFDQLFKSREEAQAYIQLGHVIQCIPVRVTADGKEIEECEGCEFLKDGKYAEGKPGRHYPLVGTSKYYCFHPSKNGQLNHDDISRLKNNCPKTKEDTMTGITLSLETIFADKRINHKEYIEIWKVWPSGVDAVPAEKVWELFKANFSNKKCWHKALVEMIGEEPGKVWGKLTLNAFGGINAEAPGDQMNPLVLQEAKDSSMSRKEKNFYKNLIKLSVNRVLECSRGKGHCHIEPEECKSMIAKCAKDAGL